MDLSENSLQNLLHSSFWDVVFESHYTSTIWNGSLASPNWQVADRERVRGAAGQAAGAPGRAAPFHLGHAGNAGNLLLRGAFRGIIALVCRRMKYFEHEEVIVCQDYDFCAWHTYLAQEQRWPLGKQGLQLASS